MLWTNRLLAEEDWHMPIERYQYFNTLLVLGITQKPTRLCVFIDHIKFFSSFFLSYLRKTPPFQTRDLSKVSFNCIYRLVWVYVVRIKCEANTTTNQRLSQIIEAIFPKGTIRIGTIRIGKMPPLTLELKYFFHQFWNNIRPKSGFHSFPHC